MGGLRLEPGSWERLTHKIGWECRHPFAVSQASKPAVPSICCGDGAGERGKRQESLRYGVGWLRESPVQWIGNCLQTQVRSPIIPKQARYTVATLNRTEAKRE